MTIRSSVLRFWVLALVLAWAASVLSPSNTARAAGWEVGDRVEVRWKGKWYPARILEFHRGQYKVHYRGYESSWDEWVAVNRIRPAAGAPQWRAGDRVQVSWKGAWYKARILEYAGGKYKVHYAGYDSSWDEWVRPKRIQASAGGWSVGDRVMVSWKGQWYPARILDSNRGQYKIHYDGYESSWDEWVGPSRMRAR